MKLFDRALIKEYFAVLSFISIIFSFISIFINIPDNYKLGTSVCLILSFIIIYIVLWVKANSLNKVRLKINNSVVNVKIGDIFNESDFKVIAFNEYFDTLVDNKVISEKTLNGIYINKLVDNLEMLDKSIDIDEHCNEKIVEINNSRKSGKKKKYRLGTIFQYNDYLLTAFSKFDKDNRAYLYMSDYINFLINFWNEVDIIYAGRSISIPLLGSGITRFKEYNMISEQELLELLIWSFKVSKIKFTYPSQVVIVIHESIKDKINFFKLKNIDNGLWKV
ncbi:macro domain-containing protein [Clostridium hydrogenum]|uniref:macro domain-containing protein n=1 Tax=Clostridium hydrogenum TaxID=2855764 RepID=UPI002E2F8F5A|nr:macro domain-containing protein [Clostridium hydrogenum]